MANETMLVSQRIRQYILKHFPLARKQSTIEADCLLLDSGIIDSLGVMDLIRFFEEEFEITISEEDLLPENFKSIECMADFVQSKGNGQSMI